MKKSGEIRPDDHRAWAEEALAVLALPEVAPLFGAGSRAEVSLAGRLPRAGGSDYGVSGRIDRLAVNGDEVLILDFKTNRPPPAREEDVPDLYLDQMALYRAGAAKVFPGKRIVCGLLFTDGPRLLRLSEAILDRQWMEMRRRLDPEAVRS